MDKKAEIQKIVDKAKDGKPVMIESIPFMIYEMDFISERKNDMVTIKGAFLEPLTDNGGANYGSIFNRKR